MKRGREEGFTLHETMIVLIVGIGLIGLSLSVVLGIQRSTAKGEERHRLRSEVLGSLSRIALDVQRGQRLTELGDSTLVIEASGGRTVEFRGSHERIWRNGQPMVVDTTIGIFVRFARRVVLPGTNSSVVEIEISGRMKDRSFVASTCASIPWSSKEAVEQEALIERRRR